MEQHRLCDGARDCPYGDDEKQCVTIAQNEETAGNFPYNSEGKYLPQKDKSERNVNHFQVLGIYVHFNEDWLRTKPNSGRIL